jgi:hypothetical protein
MVDGGPEERYGTVRNWMTREPATGAEDCLFDCVRFGKLVYLLGAIDHDACRVGVADVAVRNYANQLFAFNDWQLVDSMFGHDLSGNGDAVKSFHREHPPAHPI